MNFGVFGFVGGVVVVIASVSQLIQVHNNDVSMCVCVYAVEKEERERNRHTVFG